jgi:hypothetical protein
MPEIDPITREEKLWSGEDIEPITREEMYIKHIFDKTQPIPSKPITRKEMLLEKAGEGGGSDVTIKQLSVTENGTYSEEGTAYSPVIVNVPAPPIPDNAYLLNDVEGLPSDIATFTDGSNLPMPKLQIGIEPIQEGSGDPSPTNERPILGWSAVDVGLYKAYQICEADNFTETTSNGLTMTYLGKGKFRVYGTMTNNAETTLTANIKEFVIYGGDDSYIKLHNSKSGSYTLIFRNSSTEVDPWGFSTVNRTSSYIGMRNKTTNNIIMVVSTSLYGTDIDLTFAPEIYSNNTKYTYSLTFTDGTNPLTVYGGSLDVVSGELVVDRAHVDLGSLNWALENGIFRLNESIGAKLTADTSAVANMLCSVYKTVSQNAMGSTRDKCIAGLNWSNGVRVQDSDYTDVTTFKQAMSGVQLVYELATPITYQLTPTQVKSLLGTNNIWADTGDIEELEYFSKEA